MLEKLFHGDRLTQRTLVFLKRNLVFLKQENKPRPPSKTKTLNEMKFFKKIK